MKIPFLDGSEESVIRISRIAVGFVAFGLLVVAVVAIAPRGRTAPRQDRSTKPPPVAKAEAVEVEASERVAFVPPSRETERKSLAEASLINLVSNVVFAAARGDEATRRALVERLVRNKNRARELLTAELSKARNDKVAAGLRAAVAQLDSTER